MLQLRADEARAERVVRAGGEATSVVELLGRCDRELFELWSSGQVRVRSLAGVMGCHPGTVSRRLRRLHRRLSDPVSIALAEHGRELPPRRREMAVRVYIRGEPVAEVAKVFGMTLREARLVMAEVRGWVAARRNGPTQE